MEFTKYDMFAYQLLNYLVTKQNYQIVRVQQHRDDIWVMNAKQETYPVIRISSKSNANTLEDTDYIRSVHRVILNLIQREGPILIFNTNPDSTPIDNQIMTQIRFAPHGISDEKILTVFQGVDKIVHESEDMQEEVATLMRKIEEAELLHQKELTKITKQRNKPIITYTVIAICTLLSICAIIFSYFMKDNAVAVVAMGAYYKMNVVAAFEYWRLFTAGFLHGDILSLVLYMYAFCVVGKACEKLYGRGQFVLILGCSILVGNICTLIGSPNIITLGIGGGVFGLLGAYLIKLMENQSIRHPIVRVFLIRLLCVGLLVVLLEGSTMITLVGGLLCGVLLGFIYTTNERWIALRKHSKIAGMLFILLLCILSIQVRDVEPFAKDFDQRVINAYKGTDMNTYAEYLQRCYNKQYRLESGR